MLRFEDPIYLWLLLLIPLMLVVRMLSWRKYTKKLKKLGDPQLVRCVAYPPHREVCLAALCPRRADPDGGSPSDGLEDFS